MTPDPLDRIRSVRDIPALIAWVRRSDRLERNY